MKTEGRKGQENAGYGYLHQPPLTDQVEKNVLDYIAQENLEIGSKLPNEFELAQWFGVGRSTIREAIKILVSKNVLEVRRGAGTYVVNLEPAENDPLGLSAIKDKHSLALDLVTVRLILEPEIASMAAEHAAPKQIMELQRQCQVVEDLIRGNIDHTEEDIKFHTCIARCSGNSVVENLIPIINSSVAVFANLTHLRLRDKTIKTHRQVTDAIARHDGVGAKCAMNMHLAYNREAILKIIKEERIKK